MTKENDLRLVGKGSRRLTRVTLIRNLIKIYLKDCELEVVIEKNCDCKNNVLVKANAVIKGNYYENDVLGRFQNARDMFKFLQGYHTCFKNLNK